jgi:protein MpaA
MATTRPRAERGAFPPGAEQYGRSFLGASLIWFPAPDADRDSGLVIAGTHGDENSSVVTLSCALRTLTPALRRHHVILAVNPDGCQLGLRANARGIDLNRNFPAANWRAGETVYRWNSSAEERDVVLLTGDNPGSEPETQALCQLIHKIHPPGLSPSTIRWPVLKIRATLSWARGWPRRSPSRSSPAWAMRHPVHSAAGAPT